MFRWKVLNWNEKGNAKPTELNKKCQRFVQWKRRKFQIRPKRNNNSHIQCFNIKKYYHYKSKNGARRSYTRTFKDNGKNLETLLLTYSIVEEKK